MRHNDTVPSASGNKFTVPQSDRSKLKKAASDATGSVNAQMLAKLDYIIKLLEEGEK